MIRSRVIKDLAILQEISASY